MTTVTNAAGREVITEINDEKAVPFKGVGKYTPEGGKFGPSIPTCTDSWCSGTRTSSVL